MRIDKIKSITKNEKKLLNRKILSNMEFDYIRKIYKKWRAGINYGLKRRR